MLHWRFELRVIFSFTLWYSLTSSSSTLSLSDVYCLKNPIYISNILLNPICWGLVLPGSLFIVSIETETEQNCNYRQSSIQEEHHMTNFTFLCWRKRNMCDSYLMIVILWSSYLRCFDISFDINKSVYCGQAVFCIGRFSESKIYVLLFIIVYPSGIV